MPADNPDAPEVPLQGPAEAFRALLDRHGYGFQYALLKRIQAIASPWVIEATEFPVSFRGGATHIDFVLRHRLLTLRIVAECKRANPALVDWCFVRLPHAPRANEVLLERVRVNLRTYEGHAGLDTDNAWSSQLVYNLGFPIKGQAVGDKAGDNRTALDDAVTQVLRGANGFMEYLARNFKLLVRGEQHLVGFVVPVVFTTARLWVSDLDIDASDLATGAPRLLSLCRHRKRRWA